MQVGQASPATGAQPAPCNVPLGFPLHRRGEWNRDVPLPPLHPAFGIRFLADSLVSPMACRHGSVFSGPRYTWGEALASAPSLLRACAGLSFPQVSRVSCVLCLRSSVGGAACYALPAVRSSLLPTLSVIQLNLFLQDFFLNENECKKSMMIPISNSRTEGGSEGGGGSPQDRRVSPSPLSGRIPSPWM